MAVEARLTEIQTMTLTLECPWCDGHVALRDEDEALACDACGVVAHLAVDLAEDLAEAA